MSLPLLHAGATSAAWDIISSKGILWFSAKDTDKLTLGGSDEVQAWENRIPNGHNASANATQQGIWSATAFNGTLPGIDMDTNDYFTVAAHADFAYSNVHFFGACIPDIGSTGDRTFARRYTAREIQGKLDSSHQWKVEASTTGAATDRAATVATAITLGDIQLPHFYYNGTVLGIQSNFCTAATTSMTSINNDITNATRIGGEFSSVNFEGIIGEYIMITDTLSSTEVKIIYDYLISEWVGNVMRDASGIPILDANNSFITV